MTFRANNAFRAVGRNGKMSYLDTAKRATEQRTNLNSPGRDRYGATAEKTNTGGAVSVLSAKTIELPLLDATSGSPELLRRVMQLGEALGYPALGLGRYRFRKRTVKAGLFAGRCWWQHQLSYCGDVLLTEAIRRLKEQPKSNTQRNGGEEMTQATDQDPKRHFREMAADIAAVKLAHRKRQGHTPEPEPTEEELRLAAQMGVSREQIIEQKAADQQQGV